MEKHGKNDFKLGISVADGFRLSKELGLHKDASDSIPVEKPVFVNEDETIMVETGYGVSWDPVHRDRVLAALKKLGCLKMVHIKSCGCTDGLEVCEECDDHANEKAKPKSKPMFEQMADDIAVAVSAVVERYRPKIKKRKCCPHLVGDWIAEGFRRAKHLPKKQIKEMRIQNRQHISTAEDRASWESNTCHNISKDGFVCLLYKGHKGYHTDCAHDW